MPKFSLNRRNFLQDAALLAGVPLIGGCKSISDNKDSLSDTDPNLPEYSEDGILPPWAIGPFTRFEDLTKIPYDGNPLLQPEGEWEGENPGWESRAAFNPGVVYHDGKFHMLYRGSSLKRDQIGYAFSDDGYHFTKYEKNPVISFASADPRVYRYNNKYYAFMATKTHNYSEVVAVSDDMIHWENLGEVIPPEKMGFDAAVVSDPYGNPVKIGGRFVMYWGSSGDDNGPDLAGIAYSEDLIHWTDWEYLDLHFPKSYSPYEVCFTITDYPTIKGGSVNKNILMFVGGTLMSQGRWFYALSQVLFSRDEPGKQLAQLTFPFLKPQRPYEIYGMAWRTIWMNNILFHDNEWRMYYGGADQVVALAKAPLRSSGSVDLYNNFQGTGFEEGQRLPDWVHGIDETRPHNGILNIGGIEGKEIEGPQCIVQFGYEPFENEKLSQKEKVTVGAYTKIFLRKSHTGVASLLYSGKAKGGSKNLIHFKVFDFSNKPIEIKNETILSYWIFPENTKSFNGINDDSKSVIIDLIFEDGTTLQDLKVKDQDSESYSYNSQRTKLKFNQWNFVELKVGNVAAHKKAVRLNLSYSCNNSSGSFRGYLDDIVFN